MPVTAASTGLQVGDREPARQDDASTDCRQELVGLPLHVPNDARTTMLLAKLWNTAVDGPAARILATSVAIYINK